MVERVLWPGIISRTLASSAIAQQRGFAGLCRRWFRLEMLMGQVSGCETGSIHRRILHISCTEILCHATHVMNEGQDLMKRTCRRSEGSSFARGLPIHSNGVYINDPDTQCCPKTKWPIHYYTLRTISPETHIGIFYYDCKDRCFTTETNWHLKSDVILSLGKPTPLETHFC